MREAKTKHFTETRNEAQEAQWSDVRMVRGLTPGTVDIHVQLETVGAKSLVLRAPTSPRYGTHSGKRRHLQRRQKERLELNQKRSSKA